MAREINETLEDICVVLKDIRRALRQDVLRGEWVTVREAAEYRRVSDYTIRRWVRQGKLQADRPGGVGGRLRISRASLEKLGTES